MEKVNEVKEKMYMVVGTGEIETESYWVEAITDEELEMSGTSSKQEVFDEYLATGAIVEVEKTAETVLSVMESLSTTNFVVGEQNMSNDKLFAKYIILSEKIWNLQQTGPETYYPEEMEWYEIAKAQLRGLEIWHEIEKLRIERDNIKFWFYKAFEGDTQINNVEIEEVKE
jgi:hypothetical protein